MKRSANRNSRRPRLAMVTCVRNESRLLAANLLYHRAVGVERAYVYLDRCTDGSEEIAASFPWVKAIRVAPEDGERFAYPTDLQRLCMDRALEDARKEGFDWLLMLDADEFAVANNAKAKGKSGKSEMDRGNLVRLLEVAKRDTEVVWLATRELLPVELDPSEPFWRQQHFLLDTKHSRDILDPTDGVVKKRRGNLFHSCGKSIVRTSADVQAFNPHEWTRHQGIDHPAFPGRCPLQVECRGQHLHYVVADWRQWLDKNRKFHHEPSAWRVGLKVPFPKQSWKEAAPRMSDSEAREYFGRWVATSPSQLRRLVSSGTAIHDGIVEQVLREYGALNGATLQLPREPQLDSVEDWKLPESIWSEGQQGLVRSPDGDVRYRVADLPPDRMDGWFGPYFNGQERYRRVEANGEIAIDLRPADYAMTLQLSGWNAGSMSILLDGRLVQDRIGGSKQQALTVNLSRHDFANADVHMVQVELHPTAWQRMRGKSASAGVTEISFKPLHRAA